MFLARSLRLAVSFFFVFFFLLFSLIFSHGIQAFLLGRREWNMCCWIGEYTFCSPLFNLNSFRNAPTMCELDRLIAEIRWRLCLSLIAMHTCVSVCVCARWDLIGDDDNHAQYETLWIHFNWSLYEIMISIIQSEPMVFVFCLIIYLWFHGLRGIGQRHSDVSDARTRTNWLDRRICCLWHALRFQLS